MYFLVSLCRCVWIEKQHPQRTTPSKRTTKCIKMLSKQVWLAWRIHAHRWCTEIHYMHKCYFFEYAIYVHTSGKTCWSYCSFICLQWLIHYHKKRKNCKLSVFLGLHQALRQATASTMSCSSNVCIYVSTVPIYVCTREKAYTVFQNLRLPYTKTIMCMYECMYVCMYVCT